MLSKPNISDLELYTHLTVYGNVYPTNHRLPRSDDFVKWTEENFKYVHYNPRKDIKRYGLSITSLDGGVTGVPDLDSLRDYNVENNTKLSERDFRTFTPVYDYPQLKEMLSPIEKYLFRSHVLKLESGGFFPPHRDFRGTTIDSFRLIVPLQGMDPPEFTFLVDGVIQHWVPGRVYFVDTAKMHYLFNAGFKPTYMIVLNVELNLETVNFVTQELYHG